MCPTTGKEHWQCFAYVLRAQRWSWWKKLLSPHHFEMCHGDLASNERYCKKEGQWQEYGVKPMGNGKKRALAEACEAIKAGAKIRRIAQDYPTEFTMYHNGLKALAREIAGAKLAEIPDDFAPVRNLSVLL